MPNYNQTLQTNNSSLEEIITQLNNMPDAGGGSAAPVLQDKTITPSTSQQTVTADSGYDGLDTVTVNAMPTATQATPSVSIDANGKIAASATQSAGYVSAGTKTGTKQMTTQAAKTITPSTSSQMAVAKNVYTTGVVTVAAIPSKYEDVGTETTEYTSLNSELEEVINSLPDAASGGSSGGSVETCTVIINNPLTICWFYSYTAYENSKIIGKTNIDGSGAGAGGNSLILDNVVCGSVVTIMEARGVSMNYSSSDDNTTQFLGSYAPSGCIAFTAPTSSNVIATVTLGAYID